MTTTQDKPVDETRTEFRPRIRNSVSLKWPVATSHLPRYIRKPAWYADSKGTAALPPNKTPTCMANHKYPQIALPDQHQPPPEWLSTRHRAEFPISPISDGLLTRVVGFPARLVAWQKSCRMPGHASGCDCHVSGGIYPCTTRHPQFAIPVLFPAFPSRRPFRSPTTPAAPTATLIAPTTPWPPSMLTRLSPAPRASCEPVAVIDHARMDTRRPVPHRVNHRPTDNSSVVSVSMPVSHGKSSVASSCLCTRQESHTLMPRKSLIIFMP